MSSQERPCVFYREIQRFGSTRFWLVFALLAGLTTALTAQFVIRLADQSAHHHHSLQQSSREFTLLAVVISGLVIPLYFRRISKMTTEAREDGLFVRYMTRPVAEISLWNVAGVDVVTLDMSQEHVSPFSMNKPGSSFFGIKKDLLNWREAPGVRMQYSNRNPIFIGSRTPGKLAEAIREITGKPE